MATSIQINPANTILKRIYHNMKASTNMAGNKIS